MIKGSLSTRIAKLIPVPTKMMVQRAAKIRQKKNIWVQVQVHHLQAASESDGTKVTLGMMLTALSALAVVYVTNIL